MASSELKKELRKSNEDETASLAAARDPLPDYTGHRQRLRQRFLKSGAGALADYELLEMILYAASPRTDTKPLAKKLLAHFEDFSKLIHATPLELARVEGMGDAAVASIKVVHAAAEHMLRAEASQGKIIQSWTALLDYCRVSMGHKKIEEFRVLFLNHKNRLISDEAQQYGTVNHAPVYPREVVKRALELQASSIILAHNHPSGVRRRARTTSKSRGRFPWRLQRLASMSTIILCLQVISIIRSRAADYCEKQWLRVLAFQVPIIDCEALFLAHEREFRL